VPNSRSASLGFTELCRWVMTIRPPHRSTYSCDLYFLTPTTTRTTTTTMTTGMTTTTTVPNDDGEKGLEMPLLCMRNGSNRRQSVVWILGTFFFRFFCIKNIDLYSNQFYLSFEGTRKVRGVMSETGPNDGRA
jgi:hypothetical protein